MSLAARTGRSRRASDEREKGVMNGNWLSAGDLLKQLGGIPARRVRLRPTPGTATEQDVIAAQVNEGKRCELVDGVLVEKEMGFEESMLAMSLVIALGEYLKKHKLGRLAGEQAAFRLQSGAIVYPDICFISFKRRPRGTKLKPIPVLAPDLVVEVLSKSNTRKEIARKLESYFGGGVRLVWVVDPRSRTVRVHTEAKNSALLTEDDSLDGGDVLPGFRFSLREWFAEDEADAAS